MNANKWKVIGLVAIALIVVGVFVTRYRDVTAGERNAEDSLKEYREATEELERLNRELESK